jgi:hypothetical protein
MPYGFYLPVGYWVVAVGIPVSGLYPWAVVSGPFGLTNFVLARDVATYHQYYHTIVMKVLEKASFTKKLNEVHMTYQLGTCAYTW